MTTANQPGGNVGHRRCVTSSDRTWHRIRITAGILVMMASGIVRLHSGLTSVKGDGDRVGAANIEVDQGIMLRDDDPAGVLGQNILEDTNQVQIVGTSDWEIDEFTARNAAEQRRDRALRRWLLMHDADSTLASDTDVRSLLDQPGVHIESAPERRQRPYGDVVRVTANVLVPDAALLSWRNMRHTMEREWQRWLIIRLCLSLISLGVTVPAFVWCDRRTAGYRRGLIGSLTVFGMALALTGIWTLSGLG